MSGGTGSRKIAAREKPVNWLRKRQPDPWEPQERFNGLSAADLNTLGTYNAERGRGIVHTTEWQEQMAALQSRFDAAERERYARRVIGAYVYGKPDGAR